MKGAVVQSLIWEVKSHMPYGTAIKKKQNKNNFVEV